MDALVTNATNSLDACEVQMTKSQNDTTNQTLQGF